MRWVSLLTTILVWLCSEGQAESSGEQAVLNLQHKISWLNASIDTADDSQSKRNQALVTEISKERTGCLADNDCKAELDSSADDLNRLADGLDGGKAILDGLLNIAEKHVSTTGLLIPFTKTFLPILGKLAPFLGALGPIVNIFATTFTDSNEVQLLRELKNTVVEGFRRMEIRFQQIEDKLSAISQKFAKSEFWARVQQFKSKLNDVEEDIREYLKGADEAQRKILAASLTSYRETQAQDGVRGLLRIFKGDHSGAPLCDAVRNYTNVDRNKVRKVSAVLLRCVTIGAQHRLLIMEIANPGSDAAKAIIERENKDYVKSITKVVHGITKCDQDITERYWKDQWQDDVKAAIKSSEWVTGTTDEDTRCKFSQGDGTGAGEIDVTAAIERWNSTCVDTCLERKTKDDRINGVTTFNDGNKKNCWCEITMIGRDTNSQYKSCFLQLTGQNDDIATRIYKLLVEKYSWRMWYVVVFNQMDPAEYHVRYCKKQNEFMEMDIRNYHIIITSGSYNEGRKTRHDSLLNIHAFTPGKSSMNAATDNDITTDIFPTIRDRSRGNGESCTDFFIKGVVMKNGQNPSHIPKVGFAAKAPDSQYKLRNNIHNGDDKRPSYYREFYVFILG